MKNQRVTLAPRTLLIAVLAALSGTAAAQEAGSPISISLPSQALSEALAQFSATSGTQLLFDERLISGKTASAVKGRMLPREALRQMLLGTGLEARTTGPRVYTLVPSQRVSTLDTLTVTAGDQSVNLLAKAYAGGQVAKGVRLGVLGNTDLMNAPFSTTSYTAESIQNQQSNTIAEAVNRDPSVRYTVMPGGNVDNLYIRGFPIWEGNAGEIAFDGIYGVAPNYRVRTEYVERIEVVKGPGALLFGMSPNGSVGGVINIAPKRALDDVASITTTYTSDSQAKGHIDYSKRFGSSRQFGIRFNGAYYNGDTAVDKQSVEGNVGAVALDYEGDTFRATLDVLSQRESIDAPSRPVMPGVGFEMPSAPSGKRNVTQPWEWSKNKERSVLLRTEYDINNHLSVFANAGTSDSDVSRIYDSAPRLVSAAGDTRITPTYAIFQVDRKTVDGGLRSKFETGAVRHSVTLQLSSYSEQFNRALNPGSSVASNIFHPVDHPAQDISRPSVVPRISDNKNQSAALVDTVTMMDEALQVSLGLRRQKIESTNFNPLSGGTSSRYSQSVTTPALGIVYHPEKNVSLYANYIEGISKGDIAPPSAFNYGEVLAPYKSKQIEIGSKFDLGTFMLTGSLFQIEKPSGGVSNGFFSVNAEQRNRGAEIYAYGEARQNLRLLGGVTWIDAEFTSSAVPGLVGKRPIGVAELTGNVGVEWDPGFVPDLTLLADVSYTGKLYVNQLNTISIPAAVRLDVGARYALRLPKHDVTLRATVQNATNKAYWAGVTSWGAVSAAVPRTYVVSATLFF